MKEKRTFGLEIVIALLHDAQRRIFLKLGGPHSNQRQSSLFDFVVGGLSTIQLRHI